MTLTVTPASFNVGQPESGETSSVLLVANENPQAAVVTLHALNWPGLITAEPAQFVLNPGQQQSVDIRFSRLPVNAKQTEIVVQSRQMGESTQTAPDEIRVPVHLRVQPLSDSSNPMSLAVGLILLAAILGLAIYARGQSLWQRLRAISLPNVKAIKPAVLLSSALALILAGSLLVWGWRSHAQQQAAYAKPDAAFDVSVALTSPDLNQVFDLRSDDPQTAFSALQKVAEQYTIPLQFQTSGMGVFVTSISNVTNGTDGRYWVYEVNDQKIPVAADAYQLHDHDRLVWKFTTPE